MSRLLCALTLIFSCLLLSQGCQKTAAKPPIPVPEVVIEPVIVRDVTPYLTQDARAEAAEFVQIPARVSGFLREIRYTPGEFVQKGKPLFLIEPDQYEAEVKAAEAKLASANIKLRLAEDDLGRTETLVPTGAKTIEDLQTDTATRDEAAAAVMSAEAALDTAKLNLSYTDVCSPIAGKTDRNFVDVGNLVSPTTATDVTALTGEPGILTTVANMDPMFIYFEISDYDFNGIRDFVRKNKPEFFQEQQKKLEALKEGTATTGSSAKPVSDNEVSTQTVSAQEMPTQEASAKPASEPAGDDATAAGEANALTENVAEEAVKAEEAEKSAIPVEIPFEVGIIQGATPNAGDYPHKGILDLTSNTIDSSTGTITLRGVVPNADYSIFRGQVCRVRIPLWPIKDAVLVKQEAICADMNQQFVYVVGQDNKAERRTVELGEAQSDGTRLVLKGLVAGERIIVQGVQKVHDGSEVKAVAAEK